MKVKDVFDLLLFKNSNDVLLFLSISKYFIPSYLYGNPPTPS